LTLAVFIIFYPFQLTVGEDPEMKEEHIGKNQQLTSLVSEPPAPVL
jgi:hypothetical protein